MEGKVRRMVNEEGGGKKGRFRNPSPLDKQFKITRYYEDLTTIITLTTKTYTQTHRQTLTYKQTHRPTDKQTCISLANIEL